MRPKSHVVVWIGGYVANPYHNRDLYRSGRSPYGMIL